MLRSHYEIGAAPSRSETTRAARRTRPLAAALAVALLLGFVPSGAPAAAEVAQDERERREQIRDDRAAAASELDALNASDAELEGAVAELDAHVAAQEAQVADARRATEEARAEAQRLTDEAEQTEKEVDELEELVRSRAVQSYIGNGNERGGADEALLTADNPVDLEHRKVLIETAHGTDQNALDQLGSAREQLERQRERIAEALAEAEALEAETEERLRDVEASRDEQRRLRGVLATRIGEYRSEVDALAEEEDALSAIIAEAEEEAEQRAEEARRAALAAEEEARRAAERATAEEETSSNGSSRSSDAPSSIDAPPSASGLIWPVDGSVTSHFGQRWGRLHAGIDINGSTGTPIYAANSGTVIHASSQGGYGNLVLIDHGDSFHTAYAHLSEYATSSGASVDRGELIGYVGNTGNSTGPHLHFETRVNGSPQNPLNFLP